MLRSVKCDVILMSGAPAKAGVHASYETQASYVVKSLVYAPDVPFIDVWGLFGITWNKRASYDSLHPNQVGYSVIAGYAEMAILNPSARSQSWLVACSPADMIGCLLRRACIDADCVGLPAGAS